MTRGFNENAKFNNLYKTGKEKTQGLLLEENESGKGVMQCFDVAPGIQISYNDLKMDSCFRPIRFEKDFLQVNYCLEGCYEFEYEGGNVSFLGEGDVCVDFLPKNKQVFSASRIPLGRYRGITILLEIETAQKSLDNEFQKKHINLYKIKDCLCTNESSLIIKSKYEITNIFRDLYSVDMRIKEPYAWLKTVELLLLLSLLDNGSVSSPGKFSFEVSRRTKEVYQYIIQNPLSKDTIGELAERFGLAESSLKRCFKSLSGYSVGEFVKTKCMESAAEMLIYKPALSIGEIGSLAGYENQSKFSAAFKSVIGTTPQAYRQSKT